MYEILTEASAGFDGVNRVLPDMGGQAKAPALLPGSGRLLKTHAVYRSQYKKAVYLVRDARDVAISEYAYERALGRVADGFDDFLTLFLQGKVNSYGSWHHHVDSWLESPLSEDGNLLVVRFEDMRRNTRDFLEQITGFLGVQVKPDVIQAAITNNTVQRMRVKEEQSPQITGNSNGGDRFVRSGSVGGWREKLTDAQARRIERHVSDALARLGYTAGSSRTETERPGIQGAGIATSNKEH